MATEASLGGRNSSAFTARWTLWPMNRFSRAPHLVRPHSLKDNEREHDGNAHDVDGGEGDETWRH